MPSDRPTAGRHPSEATVRLADASDAEELLGLMRELAIAERYIDRFRVTSRDLHERGLNPGGSKAFTAYVAQIRPDDRIVGYAVIYEVPFTYDLLPQWVLKELFVRESFRGRQIGSALMNAVIAEAKQRGCTRLKWDVLPDNNAAKRFYRGLGAAKDENWENWTLELNRAQPPSRER